MKTKFLNKLLAFVAGMLFLVSCATHAGMTTSDASIDDSDFTYIKKNASESVSVTTILFIGGWAKKAMVAEARGKLMDYVRDGEVLANITVDYKTSYYIIGWTTKVTVTGDIIKFEDSEFR